MNQFDMGHNVTLRAVGHEGQRGHNVEGEPDVNVEIHHGNQNEDEVTEMHRWEGLRVFRSFWRRLSKTKQRLFILFVITSIIVIVLICKQIIFRTRKPSLFVRLHKASGVGIVSSFEDSQYYKFYQPNYNGNPQYYKQDRLKPSDIKFGSFTRPQFKKFVDQLNEEKVTFIAMDSQFFQDIEMMKYFCSFTMIRDPLTRFIVQYNLDYEKYEQSNGEFKQIDNIDEKFKWLHLNHKHIYGRNNYYVRYFNNIGDYHVNMEMNTIHLQRAKNAVLHFDVLTIFEFQNTWKNIEYKYDIELGSKYKRNGIKDNYKRPTKEFETWFKAKNQVDFQLYQYAVQIAMSKSAFT